MKPSEFKQRLAVLLDRIDHFVVKAKDDAAKQRLENFLNGFDPNLRNPQISALLGSGGKNAGASDQELLERINIEATRWAISVMDGELFERLIEVAVVFKPALSVRQDDVRRA